MPEVLDIGDGSQDALLVRIRAGGYEGWGECEAAPLPSIAAYVCPMSHSACKPVQASVLGQPLNDIRDIERIGQLVRDNSFDLLQTDHTLSGIDIALWDLMGKKLDAPVYQLLGYNKSYPKLPYASQLFGETPEETYLKAKETNEKGYRAAKFGWGPYGKGSHIIDAEHIYAARKGIGEEGILLIDAGTVWIDDVEAAAKRLAALEECRVEWLEEPFISGALKSYKALSSKTSIKLAGGEGCHSFHQAQNMIDYAGIKYIQIDTGRIGGITDAKKVADYAQLKGLTFVNHTFTTHLALSASIQPYAGIQKDVICEYPVEPKPLGAELTTEKILRDTDGFISLPEKPGLGLTPDLNIIKKYLVEAEIRVSGKIIYQTPSI